jgi:hypothetical protein
MRGKSFIGVVALATALAMPLGARAQDTGAQPNANGAPQVAQPANGGVNWQGVGIGAATLVANVGYIPAKTVYAILGGITGGAGYALTGGNEQAANSIWRSSLGGDYVLTPAMIRGDAPIHFSGPATTPAAPTVSSAQPLSSNLPPPTSTSPPPAAAASAYPNSSTSTSMASGTGAPPYTTPSHSYGSPAIGGTHITTTTEPGDSGAGPVRDHGIE